MESHHQGPDAKKAVAEMAAVLYDESLDQFKYS